MTTTLESPVRYAPAPGRTYAVCDDCGREMKPGTPCAYPYIKINGRWHKRSNDAFAVPCPDCGAPARGPHHFGCDNERCPICGMQLIGCDCFADDEKIMLGK